MAIEIKNFNPVWVFNPSSANSPQFYNGTYLFVQCAITTKNSITVNALLYDKAPQFITGSDTGSAPIYNNAQILTNLTFGSIVTDVQDNILLTASEYISSSLSTMNPGVDFIITNLSSSLV